jgi:hypothetical protein
MKPRVGVEVNEGGDLLLALLRHHVPWIEWVPVVRRRARQHPL